MIAVIADDFTGAAEIGGIGLSYGLKVIIETKVKDVSNADLLVIATDTRSLTANEASVEIERITRKLILLNPQFIYKKLDSVLRGNIALELISQMSASDKKRTIIVAANPFNGRIISNGKYTVDSIPLDETYFAKDPDFPIKTSSAMEIIGRGKYNVFSKSFEDELPSKGIVIGDVTNAEEMNKWVSKIDETTIAAGGSGFFDVILSKLFSKQKQTLENKLEIGDKTLFVLGSTYPKAEKVIEDLIVGNSLVRKNMPEDIYRMKDFLPELFETWVVEVIECLNNNKKVIISVDYKYSDEEKIAIRIKKLMAKLVKRVVRSTELTDLFIEGGATTSQILRELKIAKLYPFNELDFGIIQMRSNKYPGLCITTKPGSYLWPQHFNSETFVNTNQT
jgi:uncharacterized protein YgbK (DUF1537 family)